MNHAPGAGSTAWPADLLTSSPACYHCSTATPVLYLQRTLCIQNFTCYQKWLIWYPLNLSVVCIHMSIVWIYWHIFSIPRESSLVIIQVKACHHLCKLRDRQVNMWRICTWAKISPGRGTKYELWDSMDIINIVTNIYCLCSDITLCCLLWYQLDIQVSSKYFELLLNILIVWLLWFLYCLKFIGKHWIGCNMQILK